MAFGLPHMVGTSRIEIWKDWPDQKAEWDEMRSLEIDGRRIPVKGVGNVRAVVLFRTDNEEMKKSNT